MTRRGVLSVFFLAASLAAGCGDTKPEADAPDDNTDAGKIEKDSGDSTGGDSGDDNTGKDNGGTSGNGSSRIEIKDAPNCADDDLTTPGSDCDDTVTCGGTPESPIACPRATHSCCGSGPPSETTANCYEGTTSCTPLEARNACDGPEDCTGGKICCVTPPDRLPIIIECRELERCDESTEGTIFCHLDEDCPAQKTCQPTADAPFWGFCS